MKSSFGTRRLPVGKVSPNHDVVYVYVATNSKSVERYLELA